MLTYCLKLLLEYLALLKVPRDHETVSTTIQPDGPRRPAPGSLA